MIKVSINRQNNVINSITIKGHAKYAEYGKDIVCAATSSIVITTINAILRLDKNALEYSESNNLVITIKKHTKTIDTLITNMIELLKELQKQYEKNIQIN